MGSVSIIQRCSHISPGVAGMDRNRWPESVGISGRNASEYALLSLFYLRGGLISHPEPKGLFGLSDRNGFPAPKGLLMPSGENWLPYFP